MEFIRAKSMCYGLTRITLGGGKRIIHAHAAFASNNNGRRAQNSGSAKSVDLVLEAIRIA